MPLMETPLVSAEYPRLEGATSSRSVCSRMPASAVLALISAGP